MKKTYAFKPLCILIFIFDLILSLTLWRFLSMASDVWGLMSSLSTLINVVIFLMVGILGAIVVTILLYIYYLKQEKIQGILWDAILHTVFSAYFAVQMLSMNNQMFAGSHTLMTLIGIFVFASALLHLFVMLRLDKVIHVTVLDAYLPAGQGSLEVSSTQTENEPSQIVQEQQVSTPPVITKEKALTFLKSKNGKIALGIVAVIIVVVVGYKVWDAFFNKTVIDAFANMQVTYDGYDGAGEARIDGVDIDYDMTNTALEQFVNDISFDIEKNGELSNGDKVTVKAIYSQETAKQLKVVLKEESQTFDVSGLTVKYQSASQIDKTVYQKAYDKANQESKEESYFSSDGSTKTFYKSYYIVNTNEEISIQRNYLVFVYKEDYKSYDFAAGKDVDKVRYIYYYTSIDSSYDSEEEYMSQSTLYNDSFDYVSNEAEILPALQKQSITDYGEAKVEEVNISIE